MKPQMWFLSLSYGFPIFCPEEGQSSWPKRRQLLFFIKLVPRESSFNRPKGMTLNSYNPSGVQYAVFSPSSGSTCTCQYPLARLSALNYREPYKVSRVSSIHGCGYASLHVMAFTFRLSTHTGWIHSSCIRKELGKPMGYLMATPHLSLASPAATVWFPSGSTVEFGRPFDGWVASLQCQSYVWAQVIGVQCEYICKLQQQEKQLFLLTTDQRATGG